MNEAETRAEHIDPALKAAGWGVVEGSRIRREYPITLGRIEGNGRRGKALTADYILEYRNTKLAVVEAKAWDMPLTEGVGQAKEYAGKLAIRFTYATNGQGIYGIDMETGTEGELTAYPTPDELWHLIFAVPNAWRDRFAAIPFEDRGGYFQGRYYQDIAIERVLEAIADNKARILLTLATGTGKTFIAFQIAWKLFHSRWNLTDWRFDRLSVHGEPTRRPRILFLADRNILADQAYNAFSAFPEDALIRIAPDEIKKKGKVPKNGSIFFTIFQTFMSGPPLTPDPSPEGRGKLPEFFKNEEELRSIWSRPDTRRKLLEGLAEKGFGHDQLIEMQKIIDAEKSDLFDVLAHVAYALPTLTREERAGRARTLITQHFSSKLQIFLDFVLAQYVKVGFEELDQAKLTPLLKLKYHNSIPDAVADLGQSPLEIGQVFAGFQKFLYQQSTAA